MGMYKERERINETERVAELGAKEKGYAVSPFFNVKKTMNRQNC